MPGGVELIDHRDQRLLTAERVQTARSTPRGVWYSVPGRLKNFRRSVRTWLPLKSPASAAATGPPPRCTPTPPASRSSATAPAANAAAAGRGCPCRSRTAPRPGTRRAPPPGTPARGAAAAGTASARPAGRPALVVNSGCQRSFFGPGTTSRQMIVRTACSALSPLSTVVVSARRISLAGAPDVRPRLLVATTNRPLGNCLPRPAPGAGSGRPAASRPGAGVLRGQVPQGPHAGVGLARPGVEQGVQVVGLAARPASAGPGAPPGRSGPSRPAWPAPPGSGRWSGRKV